MRKTGNRGLHGSIEQLRNDIITAANIYSDLTSKSFLYVYGDKFFEVTFPRRCFRHLCGVDSVETAERFYVDARTGRLDKDQIKFKREKGQSIRVAKKKANTLKSLLCLIEQQVVVLEDLTTKTFTYQIGVTDLAITLCLEKDSGRSMKSPTSGLFYPRSLRVDEKALDKSASAEFANFVFVKDLSLDANKKYDKLVFCDGNSKMPESIRTLISESLWEK